MKTFGNYHPSVLMVYFLAELLICMFVSNPVMQLTALLGGVCFCAVLQTRKERISNIGFYLPLFLMVAITNPLFSHNGVTPLFFLNGNPVTMEAFIYGAAIAVMVIAVLLWCSCYSKIMTSDKFLYLFGKVIPKLSLVLSMALRFIPMFKRQMHKVSRAQKAMGLYSSKSYTDRIKGALRVFSAMIAWSMENSMEMSASMKARGYGMKGRTNFALFRFNSNDAVMLAVSALLLGITLFGVGTGQTVFNYYPRISNLNVTFPALAVYISFAVLSFMPFMIEVKESLKWKYYISKI
ncbi:MAG: energy-coupling factor transporter transmembrane protein EcfT [Faecalibacterium sp.]|nr:energy-coupling factor transporter transmembrane protein EcfT [Ruminococcus sp.]MCM1391580.1 energy-coupling factor transporter transmembrane protein EcfT [Ruminococcus sp.]MCM1485137.1 energy-coupling factor transporter transmembrane protein EcfT [Faecalibacterium sp.]